MIEQKSTRFPNAIASVASAERLFSTLARIKKLSDQPRVQKRLRLLAVEASEARKLSLFSFVFL